MLVPSVRRIIQRDSLAKVATIFFVLGGALLLALGWRLLHPLPPPRPFEPRAETSTVNDVSLIAVSVLGVIALPLRLLRVRGLFRRGDEVEGTVDRVVAMRGPRNAGRSIVVYSYQVGGQRYTRQHTIGASLWRAYVERYNATVPVVVDPARPARAMLAHAFALDLATIGDLPLPRARVVKG